MFGLISTAGSIFPPGGRGVFTSGTAGAGAAAGGGAGALMVAVIPVGIPGMLVTVIEGLIPGAEGSAAFWAETGAEFGGGTKGRTGVAGSGLCGCGLASPAPVCGGAGCGCAAGCDGAGTGGIGRASG